MTTALLFAGLIGSGTMLGASVALIWSARAYGKSLPRRQLVKLEQDIDDLRSSFDSLSASQRRLNARVGMREARETKAEQQQEPKPRRPGDSKAALRRALGVPDSPIALLQENLKRASTGN